MFPTNAFHSPLSRMRVAAPLVFMLAIAWHFSPACLGQETSIDGWSHRIETALREGKPEEALREMDATIKKYPDNAQFYILRGSLKFRSGQIEDSITDFDKSIELNPGNKPYLWQRGISLYYAGKYKEGMEQFDVHRTVNPNDVENAFWHFLCNVKLNGLEAAKKDVLLAGFDNRTPLMQVQQLIQGKTTPEEVIKASEKGGAGTRGQKLSRFYGYLYIGLYYDAIGEQAKAQDWIQKCVDLEEFNYMGDVAKIHLEHLKKNEEQK